MKSKNKKIKGNIVLHGDKSIAHRAVIIASHFPGIHYIKNFPFNKDLLATLTVFKNHGLKYKVDKDNIEIDSRKIVLNKGIIECDESGTTARLITGYFCGANIATIIKGRKSLLNRPMSRIINPLISFGANIKGDIDRLPIQILKSKELYNCDHKIKIPSAQIKSSLILYSMHKEGKNIIKGKINTRDHLEILLKDLGYPIAWNKNKIIINGKGRINKNIDISLPGDVSSASFIIGAAILIKESDITLKNILLNKYRIGFIDAVKKMGANITLINVKKINGERVGDIKVIYSNSLIGVKITKKDIPSMIDEIPILSIIASYAKSKTIIEGIGELRIKESNRINAIIENINKMGGSAKTKNNNLIINPKQLYSTTINSYEDHRIYMAFYIANLVIKGKQKFNTKKDVHQKSFPAFKKIMKKIFI